MTVVSFVLFLDGNSTAGPRVVFELHWSQAVGEFCPGNTEVGLWKS